MKKMWIIVGVIIAFILLFIGCAILSIPKDEEQEFEKVQYGQTKDNIGDISEVDNNETQNKDDKVIEETQEQIIEIREEKVSTNIQENKTTKENTKVINTKTTVKENETKKEEPSKVETNEVPEQEKVDEVVKYEVPENEITSEEITEQEILPETVEVVEETNDNVAIPEGAVGVLKIDKIGLYQQVVDGHTLDVLDKNLGHVIDTPEIDGNVGILGHNSGNAGYFQKLTELQVGDTVEYFTNKKSRTYKVSEITQIDDTDWTKFGVTKENKITLVTCVRGVPDKRYCVQAIEVN